MPSDGAPKIVPSCSLVTPAPKKVFSLLVTTASPSSPTRTSIYSTSSSAQSLTSDSLIGRDASDMSVSPAQNFLNPPPVPETPTVTRTSFAILLNSSATASVTGNTVLEPSTLTSPERLE